MIDPAPTKNGLWILPDGISLFMDEDQSKKPHDLPLNLLMKFLREWSSLKGLGQVPDDYPFNHDELQAWMRENPIGGEGEEEARAWVTKVARVAIECGLTLVWAGGITTSIRELDKLKALICKTRNFAKLEWPEDRVLSIQCIHKTEDTEVHELTLAELMKVSPQQPS